MSLIMKNKTYCIDRVNECDRNYIMYELEKSVELWSSSPVWLYSC